MPHLKALACNPPTSTHSRCTGTGTDTLGLWRLHAAGERERSLQGQIPHLNNRQTVTMDDRESIRTDVTDGLKPELPAHDSDVSEVHSIAAQDTPHPIQAVLQSPFSDSLSFCQSHLIVARATCSGHRVIVTVHVVQRISPGIIFALRKTYHNVLQRPCCDCMS